MAVKEIKHEDVFKFFWKVKQRDYPQDAYVKYNAYLPETKSYYYSTGDVPFGGPNGVTLDFFQDKIPYEYPPE